ncbi:MAG: NAD(P)-dependent oxidoreductase [Deltaproteobacteria bacterium]|nr:NAD(P)-dependent oxidoreductase [Deltaproteobacteria bacterium]
MKKRIGIIGLGRCGMPAAQRFLGAGYEVVGYARRREVIAAFEKLGGMHAASPQEVAKKTDVTIVLVLNDEQVFEVIGGPGGILQRAKPGDLVICMSTINRKNLQEIHHRCTDQKVDFVDSPFTGGPARVANGTLTLICAADSAVMEKARPHLEVIGRITNAGQVPGMAQAVKHCNQLLVCAIHAATIELIALAEKTGADPKQVCEVVGSGIGGNDYFRLLSKAILEQSASPGGMGQLWKDINIVVTSSREHNLPLLVANAAAQYFNMAVSQGLADQDSAQLQGVLQRMIEG